MNRASAKFRVFVLLFTLFSMSAAFAQTTVSTGGIAGTITDHSERS